MQNLEVEKEKNKIGNGQKLNIYKYLTFKTFSNPAFEKKNIKNYPI